MEDFLLFFYICVYILLVDTYGHNFNAQFHDFTKPHIGNWHKECFRCAACDKRVNLDKYKDSNGNAFCLVCHELNAKPVFGFAPGPSETPKGARDTSREAILQAQLALDNAKEAAAQRQKERERNTSVTFEGEDVEALQAEVDAQEEELAQLTKEMEALEAQIGEE